MAKYDVLIVGAGAAGLAAAEAVGRGGRTVCVLEARDRIGGRIFTRHDLQMPVPLELGAEFIHGAAPSILRWLKRANVAAVDVAQERWTVRGGKLLPDDDIFQQMRSALARVRKPRTDIPFAEFLASTPLQKIPRPVREFARMLVEGFDAADATCVSTLDTLEGWAGQSAADAPTFRAVAGYGAMLDALVNAIDRERVRLQLNTVVRTVEWGRSTVSIEAAHAGRTLQFTASQAIVALPLSILQNPHRKGAVRFDPPLRAKETALAQLAMGPVIKVILQFDAPFWEEIDGGRLRNASFLHSPGTTFPTFWTQLPLRAPVLSAWTAGPRAARLSSSSDNELIAEALSSLEVLFGRRVRVRQRLQDASLHNWQTDPFARGAYSYVLVGGTGARKLLAQPLSNTLFFAGEATDTDGQPATVAGALQSGERAAREVLFSP